MDKVRFACPRCQTIMQTAAEKIGYDVACPHCAHRFRLIDSPKSTKKNTSATSYVDEPTIARNSPLGKSTASDSPSGIQKSPGGSPPVKEKKFTDQTATVLGPAIVPAARPRFVCPYCQTTRPPKWKSEVSQIGWLVFAILLVTTCVFCFVGLFIREKYQTCSQCKIRLG